MPTYPSPKPAWTLTSYLWQGKGWVGSFPEKYNDPTYARVLTINKRVYKVSVFLSHTRFITAAAPLKVVSNTTHPRLWRRFLCEGVLYAVTGKRFIGVASWPAFPITLYTEVGVIVASSGLCAPNRIERRGDKVTLITYVGVSPCLHFQSRFSVSVFSSFAF